MLAEKHGLGLTVLEPNNGMLPVSDVVAESDVENGVAEIIAVEKEPEGVDDAVAFRHGDEDGGCVASAADDFFAH